MNTATFFISLLFISFIISLTVERLYKTKNKVLDKEDKE